MDYFSLQNGPFSAAIFTGFRFSASSRIPSSAFPKSANDFSKETRIRKRESSRGSCLQASSRDRYCLESPLSVANCSWLKCFSCRHAISVLLKADWTFFLRYIEINAIKSPRNFPQPKDCKKNGNRLRRVDGATGRRRWHILGGTRTDALPPVVILPSRIKCILMNIRANLWFGNLEENWMLWKTGNMPVMFLKLQMDCIVHFNILLWVVWTGFLFPTWTNGERTRDLIECGNGLWGKNDKSCDIFYLPGGGFRFIR